MQNKYAIPFGMFGIIVAIGIVFGDIGTSPLYVMQAVIAWLSSSQAVNPNYILGSVSCVIWTLTLQTTLKYVLVTLRADNKGEGGVLVLYTLIRRRYRWAYLLAAVGAAALFAEGTITPAMTVMSAVEGVNDVFPHIRVVPVTLAIILSLFLIQSFGTGVLGKYFGVIMVVWFASIGFFGFFELSHDYSVLRAFNPMYAIKLIMHAPNTLIILGAVFLCTTGAEALYADLGHCGLKNIRAAWVFVKTMLILSYLGQAAWVINNPEKVSYGTNPFFEIIPPAFKIYGVVLATIAAVIASQATITGSFTIISEAVSTKLWPHIKISYPSLIKGQKYIPSINYMLMIVCVMLVVSFGSSIRLSAAYGLSIIISMIITTLMLFLYMLKVGTSKWISIPLSLFFLATESFFLVANMQKFYHGGYVSLLIAGVVFTVMFVWYNGKLIRAKYTNYEKMDEAYLNRIAAISVDKEIPKTSTHLVYMTMSKSAHKIENRIGYSLFDKTPKRADTYWFVHIHISDTPYEFCYDVVTLCPKKIFRIDITAGFKIDVHAEQFIQLIANEMEKDGLVDLSSRYSSLKGSRGDFSFIIIQSIIRNVEYGLLKSTILHLYSFLKTLSPSNRSMFDLDPTVTAIEEVSIVDPKYEEDDETLESLMHKKREKSMSACINS